MRAAGSTDVDVRARVMVVTPEVAGDWLRVLPVEQRQVRRHKLDQYAQAMREGRWRLSSDAIAFSGSGALVNGQHRLRAVIASGTAQPFLVVWGLPDDSYLVLDQGLARSIRDYLRMAGERNVHVLSGALTLLWYYRRTGAFTRTGVAPQIAELVALLREEPSLREAVSNARVVSRQIPGAVQSAIAVGLHVAGRGSDRALVERIAYGDGLDRGDAVYRFRQWLIRYGATAGKVRPDKRAAEIATRLQLATEVPCSRGGVATWGE